MGTIGYLLAQSADSPSIRQYRNLPESQGERPVTIQPMGLHRREYESMFNFVLKNTYLILNLVREHQYERGRVWLVDKRGSVQTELIKSSLTLESYFYFNYF